MMLREEKGGRTVCSEVRERERERGKKGKGSRKGRDGEDTATAYRCWSLQQRSAALSGHRKMVSVRGELTVAYNLMFSILDSFSMGNATARNSRAQLAFLLSSSSLYYLAQMLSRTLSFPPNRQTHIHSHACDVIEQPGSSGNWVSPWGWPHSSAAPVKPSAGRGSDADRSHCLYPLPSLPPQTPAADGRAKEPSREARGKKGVGDEGQMSTVVTLFWSLSYPFFFFLFCNLLFL